MKSIRSLHLPICVIILSLLIGLFLSACDINSRAKIFKIGVIVNAPTTATYFTGFKIGLAELGYVEGQNLTYIYDGPVSEQGSEAAAQKLIEQKVDLIYAVGEPAALGAQKAVGSKNLPILFAPLLDPVGLGLADSVVAPGRNITGVQLGDVIDKRLEWLMKMVPKMDHILMLHDPTVVSLWMEDLYQAVQNSGIEVTVSSVRSEEELISALENTPEDVDAIFPLPDTLLFNNINRIINYSIERKLPLMVTNHAQVEEGGLLAFGVDREDVGRQAARMADQIFKGVKASELPIETAEYYLSINLKTAGEIGLAIPDSILLHADMIIR